MSHLLCSQIFQKLKEVKRLTIQSQHWRKVLAIGHTSGISHTCFPQVGPKGCCGDDCPVHRGHLPVVCRQSWGNEDPTWDRQEKCNNLGCHFAHVLWVSMGPEFESVCRSFSLEWHERCGMVSLHLSRKASVPESHYFQVHIIQGHTVICCELCQWARSAH